jgi:hypothetical protein
MHVIDKPQTVEAFGNQKLQSDCRRRKRGDFRVETLGFRGPLRGEKYAEQTRENDRNSPASKSLCRSANFST